MFRAFLTYLFLLIAIVNVYFLYFYEGFTTQTQGSIQAFVTIGILCFVGIVYFIYLLSSKRGLKKGMLRISLLILTVLFIISLVARAREPFDVPFVLWRWSQTALYGILVLIFLSNAHSFYKKLQQLAKKQRAYFE